MCWQYLVNNTPGGNIDEGKFAIYNQLVNGCLATGAYCVIDIHNYARWGGQIIGQGGSVTNAHLASIWYQLYVIMFSLKVVVTNLSQVPLGTSLNHESSLVS